MSSSVQCDHADSFNMQLFSFLRQSPTPFHAVLVMSNMLDEAGFEKLSESDEWRLADHGKYYVVRNGSSIIAFVNGKEINPRVGMRMMGAHTDSPCLKIKPEPEIRKKGCLQLGVEVYGGALLSPWFDRDLSIAGRVYYLSEDGKVDHALVNFEQPVVFIPSLAIHLDREANKNRSINAQTDLPPILLQQPDNDARSGKAGNTDVTVKPGFRDILKQKLIDDDPGCRVDSVLDYDLSLYDTQPSGYVGLNREFIASARLDNLLSCFIGIRALIDGSGSLPGLVVFNDHEEVGSMSAEGAQGPFLKAVLERLTGSAGYLTRCLAGSLMFSVDNAHGVHPNFVDKHDENHGPLINRGPVIKLNANQRYATNSQTSSFYKYLSSKVNEPCQSFVVRSDMACGSTIG
ncbi:MAG: M18 family aminopeptidase, partial [Gammaproteobacteria bacterium]